MIEFKIVVNFEEGLHARPASELVKVCQLIKADIVIYKGEVQVNPKSILGILTLGASHKDELRFVIKGVDQAEGAQKIQAFFNRTDIE